MLPRHRRPKRHIVSEARHGLAFLWAEPLVRSTSLILILANFGSLLSAAVFVLLFVGHLGVTPAQLGLVWAMGTLSSLLGAQLAKPVVRRLGLGPVLVAACFLYSVGGLGAVAAAFAARPAVLPLLVADGLVTGPAGGALGQVAGLRTALVVGAALVWLCVLPAVFSPLRGPPEVPGPAEAVPA